MILPSKFSTFLAYGQQAKVVVAHMIIPLQCRNYLKKYTKFSI